MLIRLERDRLLARVSRHRSDRGLRMLPACVVQ